MKKKTMVNIDRLEKLLGEKKWGMGELATYSGVKYDTVYSLKSGRRPNTRADTLKRIADALDTSVDYLLGESDERKPPAKQLPEPIRRLADVAGRLSEMRQTELLKMAATLEELERDESDRIDYVAATGAIVRISQLNEESRKDLLPVLQALLRATPPFLLDGADGNEKPNSPG